CFLMCTRRDPRSLHSFPTRRSSDLNAGEFYTPRAATQFAVEMVDPQLGETILDPACGTGGFLTHSFSHVQRHVKTPDDLELLKRDRKSTRLNSSHVKISYAVFCLKI